MTAPRAPEPTRHILNIEEAASLLGVSTKTFAKVLREGEIPGRKIGREWKFSRGALIQWVGDGRARDFIGVDDGDAAAADGAQAAETVDAASGRFAPLHGGHLVDRRRARPLQRSAGRAEAEMSIEED